MYKYIPYPRAVITYVSVYNQGNYSALLSSFDDMELPVRTEVRSLLGFPPRVVEM